jgi:acyl carrier protein
MGLDTVELVMAFEESFGFPFSDEAAARLRTPGDVIDYVVKELNARGNAPTRSLVAEIVRLRTLQQLGIKPKNYREDARFVEDFGAD